MSILQNVKARVVVSLAGQPRQLKLLLKSSWVRWKPLALMPSTRIVAFLMSVTCDFAIENATENSCPCSDSMSAFTRSQRVHRSMTPHVNSTIEEAHSQTLIKWVRCSSFTSTSSWYSSKGLPFELIHTRLPSGNVGMTCFRRVSEALKARMSAVLSGVVVREEDVRRRAARRFCSLRSDHLRLCLSWLCSPSVKVNPSHLSTRILQAIRERSFRPTQGLHRRKRGVVGVDAGSCRAQKTRVEK